MLFDLNDMGLREYLLINIAYNIAYITLYPLTCHLFYILLWLVEFFIVFFFIKIIEFLSLYFQNFSFMDAHNYSHSDVRIKFTLRMTIKFSIGKIFQILKNY